MSLTSGMKSSEWIVVIAVMAVVLLSDWIGVDAEQVWQMVGIGGTYSIGRGIAKITTKAS